MARWTEGTNTHSCIRALANNMSLERHLAPSAGRDGDGLAGLRLGLLGELAEAAADVDVVCGEEAVADEDKGEDRHPEAGAAAADGCRHVSTRVVQRQAWLLVHGAWGVDGCEVMRRDERACVA